MSQPPVDKRLQWHLRGCVERHGAVGDDACGCVKRLLVIEQAAERVLANAERRVSLDDVDHWFASYGEDIDALRYAMYDKGTP